MSSNPPAPLSLIWKDPDTQETQSFPLAPALRIGSHPDLNDVVLTFPGINPLHGEISRGAKGELELVGMGTSTFEVKGAAVKRVALEKDARLKIGSLELTVGIPGEKKAQPAAPTSRPAERREVKAAPKAPPKPVVRPAGAPRQAFVSVALGLGGAVLLAGAAYVTYALTRKPAPPPEPTPAPAAAPTPTPDPFADALRALVTVGGTRSTGEPFTTPGVVLDGNGRLLASLRAVKDATGLTVALPGRPLVELRLIARDEPRDLALLEGSFVPPVPAARLGSSVGLAPGTRLGIAAGGSVTPDAFRSALPAEPEKPGLLQREGTANGVVLDAKGLVVGFATPALPAGTAVTVEDVTTFLGTAPPPATPAAPASSSTPPASAPASSGTK